ncbi:hypothetical protein E2320_003257 [Naja naja]|nr:hypothetical protein E2320_003257 [Naja naja]
MRLRLRHFKATSRGRRRLWRRVGSAVVSVYFPGANQHRQTTASLQCSLRKPVWSSYASTVSTHKTAAGQDNDIEEQQPACLSK